MGMITIGDDVLNDYSFDEFLMKMKLTDNNYRKMHGVAMKRRVHTKNGRRLRKMRKFNRRLKRSRKTYLVKPFIYRPVGKFVFNVNEM